MKRMLFSMLIVVAGAADATSNGPVYRCGNSYSQSPCANGRALDVDDTRSAQQHAQAVRVAAEERRLADRMERDRLAAEAQVRPAGAARLSAAPVVAAALAKRAAGKSKKALAAEASGLTEFAAVDIASVRRKPGQ